MTTKAERLQGTIERRAVSLSEFELRAAGGTLIEFKGHPSLFDTPYEMYGGPDKGGWIETVNRKAFTRTLGANPDVSLNVDHGGGLSGLPIARTTAPGPTAKLHLTTDTTGLLSRAQLDPTADDDVRQLQQKMALRLIGQMSFAFRTIDDTWNDDYTERELLQLDLHRGDVSIVTNGANPDTNATLRDWDSALSYLTSVDANEALAEIRAHDDTGLTDLVAAHTVLGQLIARARPADTRTTLKVAQAERLMVLDA